MTHSNATDAATDTESGFVADGYERLVVVFERDGSPDR